MHKRTFIGTVIGLSAGLIIGFFGANSINRNVEPSVVKPTSEIIVPEDLQTGAQTVPLANGGMSADVSATLEKAATEPMNFEAQMKAGDLYRQIGLSEKAIGFYLIGLGLMPEDREANIVLANAYFDSMQFENAEVYYTKALELDPNDVNARTDLATTFVLRQPPNYERAIAEFERSLTIDAKHEATLYNLGVAYFRKGETDKAKSILKRLEEINPSTQMVAKLREHLFLK